jgi:hypothetical protein
VEEGFGGGEEGFIYWAWGTLRATPHGSGRSGGDVGRKSSKVLKAKGERGRLT